MSVTAPLFSGCTIFGNNTGNCCTTFPVTANISEGSVTCQTSANRVSMLEQCLKPLAGSNPGKSLRCKGSGNGAVGAGGGYANRWIVAGVAGCVAVAVVGGAM